MRHLIFEPSPRFPIAILIKPQQLRKADLEKHYITPTGLSKRMFIAFDLDYNGKKAPVSLQKDYLNQVLPELCNLRTEYILCTDTAYFKTLTKKQKAEPYYGYVLPCAIPGFEHINVILCPNYGQLFYDPSVQGKIDLALKALTDTISGSYNELGGDIIHSEYYPKGVNEISAWLDSLHQYPILAADIEAFDLKFYKAGLGTIGFAWDEHNGGAFAIDYTNSPEDAQKIRGLVRNFFETYKGKLIWHNAGYDLTVLIHQLWMKGLLDQEGLLKGLHLMCRNFHDTKIIAYLATNSCAGNELSLKAQSHEFAGNYAQDDIDDITKIDIDDLLKYNLTDCLSTWYVANKHSDTMVLDEQWDIYNNLMLPSLKNIIQMQLTGMPIDMAEVKKLKAAMIKERDGYINAIKVFSVVDVLIHRLRQNHVDTRNASLKTKQITLSDEETLAIDFNPNSHQQVQELLYEIMGLPVIDYTESKLPATGAETLEKLINHTDNERYKSILECLIKYSKVEKILSAFIPAFEEAPLAEDGMHYLFGSFNIGGTVSGRLSSSKPNMQQIPSSKSPYAKPIKRCFKAAPGWLLIGLDFASLEDRISALTTKDPNKLKVYTDGYDGHSLRAFAYFGSQMPDIIDTVDSINSIQELYPVFRQESKAPTFALTYQGTYFTLMANCGFSEEKAKSVEQRYHELYFVSDQWVDKKLEQATKDGYITAAFGLRIRTPLLGKVVWGTSNMPYEAKAEGRTAGNALGQSWCLLNNRAANEFMERVWASKYANVIRPAAHIHDAQYYLVPDDIEVVKWVNDNLVECVQWQDHPDIYHDEVKLGGELSVFYPSWANDISLANGADENQILETCAVGLDKYLHPEKYKK
jgi:DNA polymerase-1